MKGQATDIQIQADEIQRLKTKLNDLYVKHTGLPLTKIGKYSNKYLIQFRKVFGVLAKVNLLVRLQCCAWGCNNSSSATAALPSQSWLFCSNFLVLQRNWQCGKKMLYKSWLSYCMHWTLISFGMLRATLLIMIFHTSHNITFFFLLWKTQYCAVQNVHNRIVLVPLYCFYSPLNTELS